MWFFFDIFWFEVGPAQNLDSSNSYLHYFLIQNLELSIGEFF